MENGHSDYCEYSVMLPVGLSAGKPEDTSSRLCMVQCRNGQMDGVNHMISTILALVSGEEYVVHAGVIFCLIVMYSTRLSWFPCRMTIVWMTGWLHIPDNLSKIHRRSLNLAGGVI